MLAKLNKGNEFNSILEIDGLKIIGDPLLSVVAFKSSTKISIYSVGDLLTKKGYHLNILQYPASIHIACTMLTVDYAQDLINDLKEIMTTLAFSTESTGGDTAKIYGTAASVPDRTIIKEVVNGFLDGLTKI